MSDCNNEADIITALVSHGTHTTRYELMLPNVYTQHDNECDLFCVRKSGYCDEFEVKTSRSDFLADSRKFVQYRQPSDDERRSHKGQSWAHRKEFPWFKNKMSALVDGDMLTNYFWYVLAEGVDAGEDLPEWAGLIVVTNTGRLIFKKEAKLLHKAKASDVILYRMARKLAYRYWALKARLSLRDLDIAKLKSQSAADTVEADGLLIKSLNNLLSAKENEAAKAGNRERNLMVQVSEIKAKVTMLDNEVEVLRQYGNKDCTAMADKAMKVINHD